MKVIKDKIGDTSVLIQTIQEPVEVLPNTTQKEEPSIENTAITENKINEAYKSVKSVITEIATDLGEEFSSIKNPQRPSQVEMEFSIGISGEVKAGIEKIIVLGVSTKNDYAFRVKLTWDLKA